MKAFLDAANQAQRTDPVPDRADLDRLPVCALERGRAGGEAVSPHEQSEGRAADDLRRRKERLRRRSGDRLRAAAVRQRRACSTVSTRSTAGTITVAQFLDLNERIGGVDHDSNYVAARTAGDGTAIKRAYQAGLTLGGSGGLAAIPIFDNATSNEDERYHYGWFHFALRERLRQANGNADNMVMWRSVSGSSAEQMFTSWMEAYKSDASADPQRVKVVRARPKAAVEGCYDRATPPRFVAEPLVFSSKPVSKCTRAVSCLFECPPRGGRPAGGQHPEVPAEADRCAGLPRVDGGLGPRALEGDFSRTASATGPGRA